jgi:hypothetical protein
VKLHPEKTIRYWFSAGQLAVMMEGDYGYDYPDYESYGKWEPYRTHYVLLPDGEKQYTECCCVENYPDYKPNWDDAVLVGETKGYNIRIGDPVDDGSITTEDDVERDRR